VYNGATVVLTHILSSQVLGVVPAGTMVDFESSVPVLLPRRRVPRDNVNGRAVAEAVTPTDGIAEDSQLPS